MVTGRYPVYVHGAAALSAFGTSWRGMGAAVLAGTVGLAPSRQLASSHGEVPGSEVDAASVNTLIDPRARKLMSHPAWLGALALGTLFAQTGWHKDDASEVALFLGVGASGAAMDQLESMLAACITDHSFSLERFGDQGLAACNPLFAFQLMNNFTLCHGAILHGLGGANSAFFSRGTGTLAALAEAHWLVASGEARHAIAGGADSALHPVTWAQLLRDGRASAGMAPGEGAAVLALSPDRHAALAQLVQVSFHGALAYGCSPDPLLQGMLHGPFDLVVIAPWGQTQRAILLAAVAAYSPQARMVDVTACLGDALAATPALAWCIALDLLQGPDFGSALVLSAGIDGGIGMAALRSIA